MAYTRGTNSRLIITAGLEEKYNSFAENFKYFYGAEVLPGMAQKPRKIDIILKYFRLGRFYQNAKIINNYIERELYRFSLIVIIKGTNIPPNTLKFIKQVRSDVKLVLWTPDDLYLRHNQSKWFRKTVGLYDLIITAKELNQINRELESLGAKKVIFKHQAYDELLHTNKYYSPSKINDRVLFIGMFEPRRLEYLSFISARGISVDVFGNGWNKYIGSNNDYLKIHGRPLLMDEYVKAISEAMITIGFLRKANRDLHTTRTFEIPACCGLMLAERTDEQTKYFQENIHALYFEDKHELLEKVEWVQKSQRESRVIRLAGFAHCRKEKYSYRELIDHILGCV